MTTDPRIWFPHRTACSSPRARLVCVAFAGGGATYFRNWSAHLPDDVELWPAELPGHGSRMNEPLVDDMERLVGDLAAALSAAAAVPLILFGHSMGSAIVLELARALERGGVPPLLTVGSGRAAPHTARPRGVHLLSRERLRDEMVRLGGTSEEILRNEELMDLIIPIMRNDFRLIETHEAAAAPKLRSPILALAGRDDPDVLPAQLRAWGELTSGDFAFHLLPGGHFYLNERAEEALGHVLDATGLKGRAARCA